LLKLVEVDEHDRERAAGTGSAFPLRRQRLPEKAASFDSGESVSDRLLLQLLEDKSVVKCGGKQVAESVEDQDVLRRKGVFLKAFYVEDAHKRFAIGDRDAQHRARLRKDALHVAFARLLYQ